MMYIKRLVLGDVGSNCYILKDEKTGIGAVVDCGEYTEELRASIIKARIKELKYILLTHGHFDHINGVAELKKQFPGALIAIGEKDGENLYSKEKSLAECFGFILNEAFPDLLLKENDVLELGETKLTVLDTPGHTFGGVCFVCHSEKCVFTGDTLFKLTIGRTDKYGGDTFTLLRSVEKLTELPDDYRVFPGHNIDTTIGAEKLRNRYLRKKK